MKTRRWIVSFCCILLGVSSCVIGTMHGQGTAAPPSKKDTRITVVRCALGVSKDRQQRLFALFVQLHSAGYQNLDCPLNETSVIVAGVLEDSSQQQDADIRTLIKSSGDDVR